MKYLYAPWRGSYSKECGSEHQKDGACPFCQALGEDRDQDHFILRRFTHTAVLLNLFPYNPGHLLIIPKRHIAQLQELTAEEHDELWRVTRVAIVIMTEKLASCGTNMGANLGGGASGGSIPGHLHIHAVPRWEGDTGFLPVIADTKPLSEDLRTVYDILTEPFKKVAL
ncbi:MAG: HIT domain-containing protein [Candidatus Dependentiae bacterium]|nr:HIT domain-containing protein [Candidatus Dependentiae bacterium]